ncbi:MAG: hypothetical protein KC475_09540, partial [Cyanobacteria bacterium HKST-UBA03]|nr:hypothetical protein [Cyanobacteria bacterium HKST-UBA03]
LADATDWFTNRLGLGGPWGGGKAKGPRPGPGCDRQLSEILPPSVWSRLLHIDDPMAEAKGSVGRYRIMSPCGLDTR